MAADEVLVRVVDQALGDYFKRDKLWRPIRVEIVAEDAARRWEATAAALKASAALPRRSQRRRVGIPPAVAEILAENSARALKASAARSRPPRRLPAPPRRNTRPSVLAPLGFRTQARAADGQSVDFASFATPDRPSSSSASSA
jgi:hypothetical protein